MRLLADAPALTIPEDPTEEQVVASLDYVLPWSDYMLTERGWDWLLEWKMDAVLLSVIEKLMVEHYCKRDSKYARLR